eukprot:scaffold278683_cov28-Tisochrysis_lutea.AAC.1
MKKAMSPKRSTRPTKTASPNRNSTQSGIQPTLARVTKRRSINPAKARSACAAAKMERKRHETNTDEYNTVPPTMVSIPATYDQLNSTGGKQGIPRARAQPHGKPSV